jgi:hypothetical protein
MKYLFLLLVVMLAGCADPYKLGAKICLGQYMFQHITGYADGYLIPILDNDGKPIKCKVER